MIPLEDQFSDVVAKALRGLRLDESTLARQAGVSSKEVQAFQSGGAGLDGPAAEPIARALGLHPAALRAADRASWHPGEGHLPPTLAAFNAPFGGDMTVNFYLAWDREGGVAAAFDTGGDCGPLLEAARAHGVTVQAIFLTHTHRDHVADLDRLRAETGAAVYVAERERLPDTTGIQDGQTFTVGGLTITARATPGHSPGGTTFVVAGVEPPVAVVGDALFAGSMGGVSPANYADALAANRRHILSLPDATVICPGHGPVTTVGQEKAHNPFYAE